MPYRYEPDLNKRNLTIWRQYEHWRRYQGKGAHPLAVGLAKYMLDQSLGGNITADDRRLITLAITELNRIYRIINSEEDLPGMTSQQYLANLEKSYIPTGKSPDEGDPIFYREQAWRRKLIRMTKDSIDIENMVSTNDGQ